MSELFDIHTHIGEQVNNLYDEPEIFPRRETVGQLIQKYDERIDKIVAFPMPGTVFFNYDGGTRTLINDGSKISIFPYQQENQALIEAVDRHDANNKIIPFACVDPGVMVTEQLNALDKLSQNNRVMGLKFHTLDTKSTVDDFFGNSEIVSFCRDKKMPVIIHSASFDNVENCNGIFKWAKLYPDISICIAHLMNFSEDFFQQLSVYEKDNLFTDISPFLGLCQMMERVQGLGVSLDLPYDDSKEVLSDLFKRYSNFLLWGSDEPFGKFKLSEGQFVDNSLEDELKFLFSLEPQVREKIAGENSRRYLKTKATDQKNEMA